MFIEIKSLLRKTKEGNCPNGIKINWKRKNQVQQLIR